MDTKVEVFDKPEHEAAYLKWNEDHPWGYAAKAEKNQKTKSYVYHYSGCSHMIDKINGLQYTNGKRKICSTDLDLVKNELKNQMKRETPIEMCKDCERRKAKCSL